MRPELMNALTLAYFGDAIFEVMVRAYLINDCGIVKVNDLQKEAVKYVSAKGQASFINEALEEGWLLEEEVKTYKRGRNTKGRNPKNMDVMTHNQSTGFECVIGMLYLQNNLERLKEVFELYKQVIEKRS